MKSKSVGGGKPRLFEITPQPSSMALASIYPQLSGHTRRERSCKVNGINEANSDAHCSTVPNTSDNGDQNTSLKNQIGTDSLCTMVPESCEDGDQNTTHPEQTPNTVDVIVVEKEPCGKSLDGILKPGVMIAGLNAQCSTVPETSAGDGQNKTSQKQTPSTVNEMVLEKEACGKVPENNGRKVRSEIDWSEQEVCIKCNEGGNLLVCTESNCPLAVHEECMQCSPHFDSMGRFFCPHCTCKQVMLAAHKAKKAALLAKKALSIFLDRRMLDSGPLDENAGTLGGQNLPENEEVDICCGRTQVNRPGERSDPEFRTSDVPCDDAMLSAANEKNNALGRCQDSGRSVYGRAEETENRIITEKASESVMKKTSKNFDDVLNKRVLQDDQEADVIKKKSKLGVEPEKSKVSLDETETEKEEEEEEIDEEEEEENSKIVNDFRYKKVAQHDKEEAVIGKRPKLFVEPEKSTERELDNKNTKEAEEGMQDRGQESNGPSSGEDSLEENDEVASDSSDGDDEDVLRSSRLAGKKKQDASSRNVERLRRESRKVYFEGDEKRVHTKKSNTINKSRQAATNAAFPNAKRKRQPWTAEEEKMLKEGVQRFSLTANKNLPWRKILDFGRHVFHGTRNPDNLKDKWRTLQSTK